MLNIDISAATAWVTVALGVLAAPIAAVINQPRWTATQKRVIAILLSVVLAIVALASTSAFGDLSPAGIVVIILMVFALSQVIYALIKPTGVVDAIEQSTSSGRHAA